jgi:hypothetical protein
MDPGMKAQFQIENANHTIVATSQHPVDKFTVFAEKLLCGAESACS